LAVVYTVDDPSYSSMTHLNSPKIMVDTFQDSLSFPPQVLVFLLFCLRAFYLWFSHFSGYQDPLEGFLQCRVLGSTLNFDSVGLRWDLKFCVYPGCDTSVGSGLGITVLEPLFQCSISASQRNNLGG
jgi:hypothetical protein